MPGGIIQLVAVGSQNVFLNGNPSISFFKKVYKTYTNFASETISLIPSNNTLKFNKSTSIVVKVDRNGDLIRSMYLSIKFPNLDTYDVDDDSRNIILTTVDHVGEVLIEEAFINIGGTIVDKQYGEWIHVWNELSLSNDKRSGYDRLIGHDLDGENYSESRLYIPLNFWFNKNPGLALPLISLQYHDVEVHITLRPARDLFLVNNLPVTEGVIPHEIHIDLMLDVEYIFLDTQEREFFAKENQDYLIEQVQRHTFYDMKQNNTLSLPLQNPVKELIWTIKRNNLNLTNNWFSFDDENNKNVLQSATLLLNGIERFSKKDNVYFNRLQPFQHHTRVPSRGIHVYSFSLHPEHFQPSGSCNMSLINKVELNVSTKAPPTDESYTYTVDVYSVNYNFLRISGGMAGLAYVN